MFAYPLPSMTSHLQPILIEDLANTSGIGRPIQGHAGIVVLCNPGINFELAEVAPADNRIVSSMPHNMFGKCLSAEA